MKGNKKAHLNSNFERGKSGNPGGITKEQHANAKAFKAWVFQVWHDHQDDFKALALTDRRCGMQFLKLIADCCPKEVDIGNKDGEALKVQAKVIILPAKNDKPFNEL